jgi:hypothetical protein
MVERTDVVVRARPESADRAEADGCPEQSAKPAGYSTTATSDVRDRISTSRAPNAQL